MLSRLMLSRFAARCLSFGPHRACGGTPRRIRLAPPLAIRGSLSGWPMPVATEWRCLSGLAGSPTERSASRVEAFFEAWRGDVISGNIPSSPAGDTELMRLVAELGRREDSAGDVVPRVAVEQVCAAFLAMEPERRLGFLLTLAHDFGVSEAQSSESVAAYGRALVPSGGSGSEGLTMAGVARAQRTLRDGLRPLYETFFYKVLTHLPDGAGMKFLVDMRADLLRFLRRSGGGSASPAAAEGLRALDYNLHALLSGWFSPCHLQLERLTMSSPGAVLERLIKDEKVHPVADFDHLKRRLGTGRRCFAFLHPSMPEEPVVFVHVALVEKMADSLATIRAGTGHGASGEEAARAAIFYTISATQPGLQGVELGNFLIKRVVKEILRDFPKVETFATLSPIPGFGSWLHSKVATDPAALDAVLEGSVDAEMIGATWDDRQQLLMGGGAEPAGVGGKKGETPKMPAPVRPSHVSKMVVEILGDDDGGDGVVPWHQCPATSENLRAPLMRLAAHYLGRERRRGRALDPVANFHVRNGAVMARLNWMGDDSAKGIKQSAGLMINYEYVLQDIEANNEA